MVWFGKDLLLANRKTYEEIKIAMCDLFNVKYEEVLIIPYIEATLNIPEDTLEIIKVMCEVSYYKAEFGMLLTIYIRDDKLIPEDYILCVGRLSEILNSNVLMSDESINPFSMLLVSGINLVKHVFVDMYKYDTSKKYYNLSEVE